MLNVVYVEGILSLKRYWSGSVVLLFYFKIYSLVSTPKCLAIASVLILSRLVNFAVRLIPILTAALAVGSFIAFSLEATRAVLG